MALLDVLEYEGGNDILVYRAPQTDFNTHSTLVVRESQEAIFFGMGKCWIFSARADTFFIPAIFRC